MKLGKKTVVTIGVLLSALLCVNMILYTPASADGNTKLKTSKNDISSETVNMHQGVSMSYAQIVQTYSDEYSVSLYSGRNLNHMRRWLKTVNLKMRKYRGCQQMNCLMW